MLFQGICIWKIVFQSHVFISSMSWKGKVSKYKTVKFPSYKWQNNVASRNGQLVKELLEIHLLKSKIINWFNWLHMYKECFCRQRLQTRIFFYSQCFIYYVLRHAGIFTVLSSSPVCYHQLSRLGMGCSMFVHW